MSTWLKRSQFAPIYPAWFSFEGEEEPVLIRRETQLPMAGARPLWQQAAIPAKPETGHEKITELRTLLKGARAIVESYVITHPKFTPSFGEGIEYDPCGAHALLVKLKEELR